MSGHRFPASEWPRLVAGHRREVAEPEDYVRALDLEGVTHILDLGAGPGFFTPALLEAVGPDGHVVAVDAQQQMLDVLVERCPDPRLVPHLAELGAPGAPPLPHGPFDLAWCAFVLHEVDDLHRALRQALHNLRPSGRLVALEWNPGPADHGPPAHERLDPAIIASALQDAGFSGVEGPTAANGYQYRFVAVRGD